jgi:D-alanine-D-alanine ligase
MSGDPLSPQIPLRVAVLLGGPSAEREISLQSGAAVAHALRQSGHDVVEIDPAQTDLARHDWSGIDVAFIALHVKFGEDGQVQQLLGNAGIPYTGCGVEASRLAFSKSAAKERFVQHLVPTPAYVLIHESDSAHHILQQANRIGFPLVVKPDTQGSSLGVSVIPSADLLPQALTRCFHYDSFGLLEQAIVGTEWTVGVLDHLVLPLIRIDTPRQFFDYQAKYEDGETQYLFEFDLTSDVVRRIEQTAVSACRALDTRGLVRVDLRLDAFHRPWVLEINTVPGLTDHSLVPKAAARQGISFPELCQRMLESALRLHTNIPR